MPRRTEKSQPFAKRSLGQNFLSDPNIVRRIISSVELAPEDTVIEIGPGRGALTEQLLNTGARVIAIEIDDSLAELLSDRFASHSRFSLIHGDILTTNLFEVAAGVDPKPKVVGNLPYNISTAIIQKLSFERDLFTSLTLMLQREVADRISAEPGSSERGYLTVLVESAFGVTKLFDVSPQAFRPVPKVWSTVVRLTPKPRPTIDGKEARSLVSAAFAQKRKTLANNLKSGGYDAETMLTSAEIDGRRRAETLTIEEWERLADTLY